jgi:hypothetical protein
LNSPITTPLTADLPENWQNGDIVAPSGTAVGLTNRHGYNYLMQKVNEARNGINTLNAAFPSINEVPSPPGSAGQFLQHDNTWGNVRQVPTGGTAGQFLRQDMTWQDVPMPRFIYYCKNAANDKDNIASLVNTFFSGSLQSMMLIVTGTMGTPATSTMTINTGNTGRGAICHLDFTDCDMSTISGLTVQSLDQSNRRNKLVVKGAITTSLNVVLSPCDFHYCTIDYVTSNSFTAMRYNNLNLVTALGMDSSMSLHGCYITDYVQAESNVTIESCKIITSGNMPGVNVSNTTSGVTLILKNNQINGSGYDILNADVPDRNRWYITGNRFNKANIWIENTAITQKLSNYVYMPQYSNWFNQTI